MKTWKRCTCQTQESCGSLEHCPNYVFYVVCMVAGQFGGDKLFMAQVQLHVSVPTVLESWTTSTFLSSSRDTIFFFINHL